MQNDSSIFINVHRHIEGCRQLVGFRPFNNAVEATARVDNAATELGFLLLF